MAAILDTTIRPYSFDSLSDALGSSRNSRKGEEKDTPPPPTFTEEELLTKTRESHALGVKEGLAQGRKEAEDKNRAAQEQLAKALGSALPQIQALEQHYQQSVTALRGNLPALVVAAAQKVAGKSLVENPMPRITEAVEKSITLIASKPAVNFFVHSSMSAALEEQLKPLWKEKNIVTTFAVLTDDSLKAADIRIEWKDGGVATDADKMWQEVQKVLEETL